MIIQIYEIADSEEAELVVAAGVDHIGVLVGNGEFPREIPVENAGIIFACVPATSRKVALTLSSDMNQVRRIVQNLRPDILHIGSQPEAFDAFCVASIKKAFPFVRIMRTIPVVGNHSIDLAKKYESIANFLLLDTYRQKDDQLGATGLVHDWSLSRAIVEAVSIPVILAGGLGPENVQDAIRIVRPAGVDSKTRTDREGTHKKDMEKVRAFVRAARNAD